MTETRWWKYVLETGDGMSYREIASRAGIDPSALSRWKRGDRPDVYFALKFARAYQVPVLQALVEAELITDEEAGLREVQVGAEQLTNSQLIEELSRRLVITERGSELVDRPAERPALRAVAHDPGYSPEEDPEIFD